MGTSFLQAMRPRGLNVRLVGAVFDAAHNCYTVLKKILEHDGFFPIASHPQAKRVRLRAEVETCWIEIWGVI